MNENPAHSKNLKKPTKAVDKPNKIPKKHITGGQTTSKGATEGANKPPQELKDLPHYPHPTPTRPSHPRGVGEEVVGRATTGQQKVRRDWRALGTPREEGQVRLGKVRKDLSEPGGDLNWVMDISPVTPQAHRGGMLSE